MFLRSLHLLFLVLLVNFTSIYGRVRRARMVGDEEAEPGKYTYTVAIFQVDRVPNEKRNNTVEEVRHYKCSGGIIGDTVILTAAQCVVDPKTNKFNNLIYKVVANTRDHENSNNKEEVEILVEKIYIPRDCDISKRRGDIAVLRLAQGMNLIEHRLQYLFLAIDNPHFQKVNAPATVTGFGAKHANYIYNGTKKILADFDIDGKLRYGHTVLVENSEFARIPNKDNFQFGDYHLLAQHLSRENVRKGICLGDTGGPLVVRPISDIFVIGVAIEMFDGCDERKYPSLYTKVTHYSNFIKYAMNDHVNENMRVRVV